MSGNILPNITWANTQNPLQQPQGTGVGPVLNASTIVLTNNGAKLIMNNLSTVGPNDASIGLTQEDPSGNIVSDIFFADNTDLIIQATSSINMFAANVQALNTYIKPSGEVSTASVLADYIEVSTINAQGAVDIDGQVLTATPTELLLNGLPLATTSNLSSLTDWALDPAVSSINVNGQDILNANNIQGNNGYFQNLTASNFTALSTIQTQNFISTAHLFADTIDVSSINGQNISDFLSSSAISPNQTFSTLTVSSFISTISLNTQETLVSSINGYTVSDFLSSSAVEPNPTFSTVLVSSFLSSLTGNFSNVRTNSVVANTTQTSTLTCALNAVMGRQLTTSLFPVPSATYTDANINGNLTVAQWNNSAYPYPNVNIACDKFKVGNFIGQTGGENAPAVEINGRSLDIGSIGSSATANLNGIAVGIVGSATAGITSPVTTLTGGIVNITGAGGVAVTGAGGVAVTGGTVAINSPIGVTIQGGGGVAITGGLGVTCTSASVSLTGGGSVSIIGGGGVSVFDAGGATFRGGEVGLSLGANLQMNTGTIYTGGSIINSNAGAGNWVKFRADNGIYVQDINASTPTSVQCGSVTLLDGTIPGSGVPLVLSNVSTNNLYANGQLVAQQSQLSNWATYTATSTINMNGNDIINANDMIGVQADFDYMSTNQISASSISVGVITATTAEMTSSITLGASNIPLPQIQRGFSTFQSVANNIQITPYANSNFQVFITPFADTQQVPHANAINPSTFQVHAGGGPSVGIDFQWATMGDPLQQFSFCF